MKTLVLVCILAFLVSALMLSSCGGTGCCVSDAVSYSYGDRVYCYDDWDKSDCEENDSEQVNGAGWTFYRGQTCEDRDLVGGSNPWP
ncbi:MAG: hypothetical protein ACUVWJ_09835 [Spirochaetota bacterium]